jgi:hypothetical protein
MAWERVQNDHHATQNITSVETFFLDCGLMVSDFLYKEIMVNLVKFNFKAWMCWP